MKNILQQGSGPLHKAFYLPAITCLALVIGALFLPEGSVFSVIRGMTVGMFAVILVATIVAVTTVHRREAWRKQTRTLDDLEPLGDPSVDPIERDRP